MFFLVFGAWKLFYIEIKCTFALTDPATLPTRTASHGGAFLFYMAIAFNKPFFTVPQQIALLQQRGLTINTPSIAEHYLNHVGYYRLAGYWQIFQTDPVRHIFIQNTPFEAIIDLYNFDRELRFLVYDAIERIEISFRSVLVNQMCTAHGSNWYDDFQFAQDEPRFNENLNKINEELDRSKEEFIRHHETTYGKTSYPPAWKTMQVLSFGTLSKVYSNINTSLPEKNTIARFLGMPNYVYLVSWMQSISILRNLCAHHSRICNRRYDFPPKKMDKSIYPWVKSLPASNYFAELLYNQLCALKFLLDRVSPGNDFGPKLKVLIGKYPGISLKGMGFPIGWDAESLWV